MEIPYTEKITSSGTSLLFLFLSVLFFLLFGLSISSMGFRFFPGLFAFLGAFFALYVLNYRVLKITITASQLILKFGIISWKTSLDNIRECRLDDSPALIKFGGAGVHFAFVKGMYRIFFNFLEYPRVLVSFIKKQGPVQGLVFSTRQPGQILDILKSRITKP
jgi:hypothetical protein